MWERIKNDFQGGITKIKWLSSILSERLKIEISIMKLLYRSEQLKEKRSELLNKIGQRVYELKENPERFILKDGVVIEALGEIERIEEEIERTKKKVSDISKVET
ncbi:MAG: hypothetical protein AB1390_02715 [Nitrospirota bacterium]